MINISTYHTTTGYFKILNCLDFNKNWGVLYAQKPFNYLYFQSFDFERAWLMLFRNVSWSLHGLGVYVCIMLSYWTMQPVYVSWSAQRDAHTLVNICLSTRQHNFSRNFHFYSRRRGVWTMFANVTDEFKPDRIFEDDLKVGVFFFVNLSKS